MIEIISKLIRIKGVHFKDTANLTTLPETEKILSANGFEIELRSKDGMVTSYLNPKYDNQNKNTLIFFNYNDDVVKSMFISATPDELS